MAADKNPFAKFLTHFEKGHVLFHEGDSGEDMFIIQSGKVAIKKRVKDGGDATLAVLEKGDFFGEMALLERLPRSATAEVIEEGDLIVIGGDTLGDMIKTNPEIAVRMLRKISKRLAEANDRIAAYAADTKSRPAGEAPAVAAPPPPPVAAAPPAPAMPPAALVVVKSGNAYPLDKALILIGRHDPVTGIHPEVDLSKEELGKSVSRRHAKIEFRDGKFFLTEEIGTLNNTTVNGVKLETGVMTPLLGGDEIGLGAVKLLFRQGPA